MLRVVRHPLPGPLQDDLTRRHEAVTAAANLTASQIKDLWESFKADDRMRGDGSLLAVLRGMFASKCAYCESERATAIEHHWPKAPHLHNQHRGSPSYMFLWENLLLICSTCNGFECKASHMSWDRRDRPMILHPCSQADDPGSHFTVLLDATPTFVQGWIVPREHLAPDAEARAVYTIKRLKLNLRENLCKGRRKGVRRFRELLDLFDAFGPDFPNPAGHTIRQKWREFLDPEEPYLAAVRQILNDNADLKHRLLRSMPELDSVLSSWALPLGDPGMGP